MDTHSPAWYLGLWGNLPAKAWWGALVALATVAVLIPLLRPVAVRIGLTDHPGGRKQHALPTPMHGGLCILLAMVLNAAIFNDLRSTAMVAFYLGGGLLLLVGVLDDRFDLNWKLRIGAQALAAIIMMYIGGVSVQQLADVVGVHSFPIGILSLPVTVFVVVGMINALNMSDGVDGLAGGQALVSILLFACFALYAGNVLTAERLLTTAGAIVGFLIWNMRWPGQPRARVFLGDAGSTVLGFMIAWTSIRLSQNPMHPVSPVLGPWTIAIPLVDCCVLILRRLRQGRSPFAADRDHLHHLLLDAGYSPRTVTLGLMAVSSVLGLSAAVALKLGIYRPLLVLLFFGLIALHYHLTADRARAVAFLRRLPLSGRHSMESSA